jgi:quercetin dioxygenase-like cupin family protein
MTGRVDPVVVSNGDGERMFDRPRRTVRVLVERDEVTLTLFHYGPGEEGPGPHVHRRHTDAFYVLAGELEVGLGPDVERSTVGPGILAAAPPGVVHTFRNASEAPVLFLNVHAPSMGFADMLRAARDGRDAAATDFDQFDPPEDGGRPLADALLRGPGEDAAGPPAGTRVRPMAEGADADGLFSLREIVLSPGATAQPPGRAPGASELLYVLASAVALRLDGQEVEAGPGDVVILTPGDAPELASVGGEPTRLLSLTAPTPQSTA